MEQLRRGRRLEGNTAVSAPVGSQPGPPTAPPGAPPTPGAPPPPARHGSRTARVLGWIAASLAVVVVLTTVGGYLVYRHLNGNITHIDAAGQEIIKRPPKLNKAQNILLIGSDTRAFSGGAAFGRDVSGARSDTTILVHLSAGGGRAVLVSIPRDSYVMLPACRTPGGGQSAPHLDKFNAAYSIGGPACTIATVESLTHVHIDHFVEVNFQGFQRMVNALGGVSVCIARPINDPFHYLGGHIVGSGLKLSAGTHTLHGSEALAFVRARYGVGDGSDIGRIKDQQLFISAVIRKATSAGLLVDVPALYRFLDAATKSIRTDPHFGLPQLKSLADRLHGLSPGAVRLVTVPFLYDAPGVPTADIAWDPAKAPLLWNALREDTALPGEQPARPAASATASPLTVAPSAVRVTVLNATGTAGLAHRAADQLAAAGFHAQASYARATATATVVRYAPADAPAARTLAAAVPGSVLQVDASLGAQVQLVIAGNYNGVRPVHVSAATPTPRPPLDTTTAAQDLCTS